MATRATLFNPTTGKREAIDIGSQRERELFAQGYKLETQAPALQGTRDLGLTQGYEKISGTQYPTRELQLGAYSDIQHVGQVGQAGSYLTGKPITPTYSAQESQPVTGGVDPYSKYNSFNKAITDLLRRSQGTSGDLQKQKATLMARQFGAVSDVTPEQLRVLSPQQQAALRGESETGYREQLLGVTGAIKEREKQQENIFGLAKDAQKEVFELAKTEIENARPDILVKDYTDNEGNVTMVAMDKNTGQELWRQDVGDVAKTTKKAAGRGTMITSTTGRRYTATESRILTDAGLIKFPDNVKAAFLSATPSEQNAYIYATQTQQISIDPIIFLDNLRKQKSTSTSSETDFDSF